VVGGRASIPALVALFFVNAAAETVFDTAWQATLPMVVDRDDLPQANGWLQTIEFAGNGLLGPAVGGVLFAAAAAAPFAVDAASFGISALLLATMAQDVLGLDARGYGLLLACPAVGGVLGGTVAARLHRRVGDQGSVVGSILLMSTAWALLAATTLPVVAGTGIALYGLAAVWWNVVTVSFRQAVVPNASRAGSTAPTGWSPGALSRSARPPAASSPPSWACASSTASPRSCSWGWPGWPGGCRRRLVRGRPDGGRAIPKKPVRLDRPPRHRCYTSEVPDLPRGRARRRSSEVEQAAHNRCVGGSSPPAATR
jgi:hypothetical protein